MTGADLQRIADELGEPIEIVRDLSEALQCCADEELLEAQRDRFERARDAAYDAPGAAEAQVPNVDAAIEAATRVRVTHEIETSMLHEVDRVGVQHGGIKAGLIAAFRAAGFEVEE